MSDYDYTAGDSIPEDALDAANFTIAGPGSTSHDADKSEAENSFSDMEPGDYLLKVVGFGKLDKKLKETYLNGKPVTYEAYQVEVRFADATDPRARIRSFFLLPPATAEELIAYNTGTNAAGKAAGFQAQIFVHFLERLLPDRAYQDDGQGGRVMTPYAQALVNWIGKMVWTQVEAGKASDKINPATQEAYPTRSQIKAFSFKPYVEGGPSPYTTKAKPASPLAGGQVNPTKVQPVMAAANGTARRSLDGI